VKKKLVLPKTKSKKTTPLLLSEAKEKITFLNKAKSASVLKHTQKNWDQWIELLNKSGATHLTHQEIVRFLAQKYKLSLWWQQVITSGYEIYIGRKIEGRNEKGEYATVATKTIAVDSRDLWKFMTSHQGQSLWLRPLAPLKFHLKETFELEGGIFGEIRTIKAPLRMRLSWQDTDWNKPTVVQMTCVKRPHKKSILVVQHEKLKDARLKNQMRDHWKQVLQSIATAIC
jgi:uncharacterized protein YndB with AHSA1/START domain